ncbi:hypothetical protein CAPTEDRAFT_206041 [Capitella teleta]|uniref:Uncharacterized protein n=1 Tax=Capitella teleta TaxID=283909 RepID=R7URL8_CAPTE|nr:hypothetical protein CAPTEDRAFT_206041 [Capitella teleta]|eukprot:ELU08855.1 hypothetical protein CAPTEDRAFT_206041 [Capitella teleta]
MPMTHAERMRRYRCRIAEDPDRRSQYLAKQRMRYHARKASGKVKTVDQMTDREHRKAKKYWRAVKAQQRKAKKSQSVVTPPPSPTPIAEHAIRPGSSRASREKNRKKMKKVIDNLADKLEKERKRSQKYKKRWLRATGTSETPRRKTKKFLRSATGHQVQRKLLLHNVLLEQLKSKYIMSKHESKKREFQRLFTGSLIKKYKLKRKFCDMVGLPHLKRTCEDDTRKPMNRKKYNCKKVRVVEKVHQFYLRDDNSRMTAGKKETKTFRKMKKQRRFLTDSIRNLHEKYLIEHPKISYSLFAQLRPFWVVQATEQDRQTCLCRTHENFQFILKKLHSLKAIKSASCETVVKEAACDIAWRVTVNYCNAVDMNTWYTFKGRENWLKMDFESLFDAPKMILMPGPHKEYHR